MTTKRLWMPAAILLAVLAFASGCAKRQVVLVPPGEPVQLAEPVDAYIYVTIDGQRKRSSNRVTLPQGWWCLPDSRPYGPDEDATGD